MIKPWGYYQVLSNKPNHKVKRIHVYPGKRISLQRHHKRSEHWYIIEGEGVAAINDEIIHCRPGMAMDIPRMTLHRIENNGTTSLIFIEIQTGDYFGEDDIERLEDDYGRV